MIRNVRQRDQQSVRSGRALRYGLKQPRIASCLLDSKPTRRILHEDQSANVILRSDCLGASSGNRGIVKSRPSQVERIGKMGGRRQQLLDRVCGRPKRCERDTELLGRIQHECDLASG